MNKPEKPTMSIKEFLKDTSLHTTCQLVDVTKQYLGRSFVFVATAPKPKPK